MSHKLRLVAGLVAVALSLSFVGCSKNNDDDDDDDDDDTVNSNPTISSVTVTPGFVVAGMGNVTGTVSASDPDGDSLSYVWDVSTTSAAPGAGAPLVTYNGANFTHAATGGGTQTARVTVSDGRGGSVSETREFGVASRSAAAARRRPRAPAARRGRSASWR